MTVNRMPRLLLVFFFCASSVQGQNSYTDSIWAPAIRSVQFESNEDEIPLPVLELGGSKRLRLSFDDLSGDFRNLYYSIEHCTAGWEPSLVPPIQYRRGMSSERIAEYRGSFGTYQEYTHYELELPTNLMAPLISGNYVLKVFENDDPQQLLLTRRFYVLDRKVSVQAQMERSSRVNERQKRQKLNFSIYHPNLQVTNPFEEVKVYVSQNGRHDNALWVNRPVFVRAAELVYDQVDVTDFYGGNEFRRIDLRSLRFLGEGVADLYHEDIFQARLLTDEPRLNQAYSSLIDYNGRYFIRSMEGGDPEIEADYARVNFRLSTGESTGNYYVFGELTGWKLKDDFKMNYDPASRTFQASPLLKQGLYDYMYVEKTASGEISSLRTESDHYQTENDYYIFVYYRRIGSRYDELVGFQVLNSANISP